MNVNMAIKRGKTTGSVLAKCVMQYAKEGCNAVLLSEDLPNIFQTATTSMDIQAAEIMTSACNRVIFVLHSMARYLLSVIKVRERIEIARHVIITNTDI